MDFSNILKLLKRAKPDLAGKVMATAGDAKKMRMMDAAKKYGPAALGAGALAGGAGYALSDDDEDDMSESMKRKLRNMMG